MSIKIEQATAEDAGAIAVVKNRVWPEDDTPTGYIARIITQPDHVTLLAKIEKQVVGFVDGFMVDAGGSRRWEVDLLAVHPDHLRKGIAQKLVSASTQAGQVAGAAHTRALVAASNIAAQRSFASCQYRSDKTVQALYISSGGADDATYHNNTFHLIPVNTLNYRGIWIEGQFSAAAFRMALAARKEHGLDIAGAVIPDNDTEAIRAAAAQGFERVGSYHVWWYGG